MPIHTYNKNAVADSNVPDGQPDKLTDGRTSTQALIINLRSQLNRMEYTRGSCLNKQRQQIKTTNKDN